MKKFLLVLGMIACVFGMTACGEKAEEAAAPAVSEEMAMQSVSGLLDQINMIVLSGMQEQYKDDAFATAACTSWASALEEIGNYESCDEVSVAGQDKDLTFTAKIKGSEREATVVIIVKDNMYDSLTVNPKYTMGELMKKAALNTLIGMGSVFCVLILISLIISCFNYIPKIEAMFKKEKKETMQSESVANAVAQIVENEELSDDAELVAVIAAAIASYEGTSSDGFVVRSIRRANANKWRNA